MNFKPNDNTVRVHISAYPAERYLYFDTVYNLLSENENLDISFSPSPNDSNCDLPENTKALVIFASEKYFTAKNSGFISEYLKAKERKILVIPLLFDDGIINLLNTRCGKAQYISVNNDLLAATNALIEKLTSDGANISQQTTTAEIFISYRKKDRAELEALLKVLRSIEHTKDLGIWYDDNITPGEHYENKIFSAIEACRLFILLITPSMLEENNFVIRSEYPKAHSLGKRIVAIEAHKTDRKEVARLFPHVHATISIQQTGAIKAEILRLIKNK